MPLSTKDVQDRTYGSTRNDPDITKSCLRRAFNSKATVFPVETDNERPGKEYRRVLRAQQGSRFLIIALSSDLFKDVTRELIINTHKQGTQYPMYATTARSVQHRRLQQSSIMTMLNMQCYKRTFKLGRNSDLNEKLTGSRLQRRYWFNISP